MRAIGALRATSASTSSGVGVAATGGDGGGDASSPLLSSNSKSWRGCTGDSSASDSEEDSAARRFGAGVGLRAFGGGAWTAAAGTGAGAARRGPVGAVKMDFGPSTPGLQAASFVRARAGDAAGGGRLWRLSALGGGGRGGGGGAGTA